MTKARIFSINISSVRGVKKQPVNEAALIKDFGIEGDAHGGPGDRQISLLSIESINVQNEQLKQENKDLILRPGDFAENITMEGLDLSQVRIGDRFLMGENSIVEISKIGKECHNRCHIYDTIGNCIMPRQGIFVRVLKDGRIKRGDSLVPLQQAVQ